MIKVAVIGCGYWGPNIIRNISETEGAELVACCDINQKRLSALGKRYPSVKMLMDYKDILKDASIDAVILVTPPETHHKIAKEALNSGKHVLVEKPLTFDVKEAEELVSIADKTKKILMVGHTFEYNPAVIKAKEYITAGDLGKVHYITSRRLNLGIVRDNINAMWSLAPHDISIINYLLDSTPDTVKAAGNCFLREGIEDLVFMYLEYPGNIIAHVAVSWLDPHKIREMVIVGSKRMVVYDDIDNEGKIKIYDKGVDRLADDSAYGQYQLKLRAGDLVAPKISLYEPLLKECQHFIECITSGKAPRTDGRNGLRVVRVLDAAFKSLKNDGVTVKIKKEG